ncbi:MAG: alpha amylase C-terminal domain-containing protein, partial [Clostridia bacterium]|nr:alpha amylase C-terminal domain-containing protein [Clostridia bacterium]
LKGSLINKMFGEYDTKFAQLKALLGYQYAHPGKKLNFMGVELAQWNEWSENRELDWSLLTYPKHDSHRCFVRDLNKTYAKYKPLYQNDANWEGFKWLLADDAQNSVLAFERLDKRGNTVLVVINFSVYDYFNYGFCMDAGEYSLIINSDEYKYGGRGVNVGQTIVTDTNGYAEITIPASSVTYYYKPAKKSAKRK